MNKKVPIIIAIVVLAMALVGVLIFGIVGKNNNGGSNNGTENSQIANNNNNNSENNQSSENDLSTEDDGYDGYDPDEDDEGDVDYDDEDYEVDEDEYESSVPNTEKWQEGDVKYNGKYYRYNNKIKTYLIMGIDKDTVTSVYGATNGGQSDAMFLLVVDSTKEKVSVISINRNTMTYVFKYNESGKRTGILKAQICIQHGYGDGKNLSCTRAADAVSRLFDNIPIQGYLSLRMGAIPILNDAVGGVKVKVLNDLTYGDVILKEGEVKTLKGMESYWYLRGRSKTEFDSATDRLRRQEQYISAFIDQTKAYTGGDVSKMVSLYESIEKYVVTNIDFAELAEELVDYNYADAEIYTVPGETIMGKKYEEYHVDEEKLYDMIIDIFYNEV